MKCSRDCFLPRSAQVRFVLQIVSLADPSPALAEHAMYDCIFGISIMKEFTAFTTQSTWYRGSSVLLLAGPKSVFLLPTREKSLTCFDRNRVYWFFIKKVGKKLQELPHYTKEDEERLAKEHENDKAAENLTFKDLYAAKISSTLTPLPEYVFKRWHFKRIMTIGDAAHKVSMYRVSRSQY